MVQAAEEKKGKKSKARKKACKAPKGVNLVYGMFSQNLFLGFTSLPAAYSLHLIAGEADSEATMQTDALASAASMQQQGSQKVGTWVPCFIRWTKTTCLRCHVGRAALVDFLREAGRPRTGTFAYAGLRH